MEIHEDALDALLLVVVRMVFDTWPYDGAYHVGMAMGQIVSDRRDREDLGHQQPGEWRSYYVDGQRFSIRRNASGELEVSREETP